MSGLALSRRHQGHCNEIERGGEEGEKGEDKENGQQTEVSDGEAWPIDMSDFYVH